ncbi:MAG: response regulator receiver protein [Alphaproteobacteria bacterium]|nr:response regulator receiver protein [Alphaproteobacteria bacterium]MDB5740152.1 response regulator receiver protein [Alphaproteobacteria bacterium]
MPPDSTAGDTVIVIDDHAGVRDSLRSLLETEGFRVKDFATAEAFLADGLPEGGDCLVVDVRMPGMSGLELQEELRRRKVGLPLIVVTGHADVTLAVQAMKAGATDFLEKPFDDAVLLTTIARAIADGRQDQDDTEQNRDAIGLFGLLTEREREVLGRLTLGESNKVVAHHLGISPRTVEIHRAHLQEKLKARSLSDLMRVARLAGQLQ